MANQTDKQAPYEVWLINHAIQGQTRVTGRFDRSDAIDIAQREIVNKRKFVEAKVLTSRTMETVFSVRGDQ